MTPGGPLRERLIPGGHFCPRDVLRGLPSARILAR